MSLSSFSVHRPVFVTMVALIVIILGGVSLMKLPIDLMPDITYPTLSVTTTYENASPEEMEELVTRPIEQAVSSVTGVEHVTSFSSEGNSNVRISFSWGTDVDAAANDVRDRLDRVIARLPEECDRPALRKFDMASFPVLMLGASSHLDPVRLRDIIDEQIKYRIERQPGVASLDVWGGLEREIHVNLRPDKVRALGLSLDKVLSAIDASNVNLPAGFIDQGNYEITIRTPGEYSTVDEVGSTVLAVRDGAQILLRDVAEVVDTWQKPRRLVRIDGQSGLRLSVYKQSGRNTVDVAQAVLKEIDSINRDMPQIKLTVIIDTSDYIQRSISTVAQAAIYGGLLAILILVVFLRHLPSTLVIAASIPVSIVATFALMYFCNFTLNLMTLGGLALGVGMLLDNSIVVLENIHRLREEEGMPPKEAAVQGSGEVGAAIVSSTLTTVAVFLPLVFVEGMSGVMFKQLAWVIGFALLCSLVAALCLVPMLAARLTGEGAGGATRNGRSLAHKLYAATGHGFAILENEYKRLLHVSLNHRAIVVALAVMGLGGSLALIPLIGVELMPATDEGEVRVYVEGEVGVRIGITEDKIAQIEKIVRDTVPELKNMVSSVGGTPWRGGSSNTGEMRIALKPLSQRKRSSEQVVAALRKSLAKIPGVQIRTRVSEGFIGRVTRRGSSGEERIEIEIRGHDLNVADALAEKVKELSETVLGVTDARITRESGAPEELVVIDRLKAADMRVDVSLIANAVKTALGGTRASYFREAGKEYEIVVKVAGADRMSLRDILDLTVTSATGEQVVLRNVAHAQRRIGPVRIERREQERVTTVAVNIADRDVGSIISDLRDKFAEELPIPRGFEVKFSGEYEEQQKAFVELMISLALSLVLVYMVMACQYESLRDPFVVMFSVPFAAIGVCLMLFLTGTTFNIQSFIGCIMLGGIVVNNAILLVDHTNLLRRRDGMRVREAIEEAGRRRLRPILMTALTTILGLVPLALELGEGSEAQSPMARAVVGGLLSSTLITLVIVPVVYSLFENKAAKEERESVKDG